MLSLAVLSCRPGTGSQFEPVRYVQDIVSDTAGHDFGILRQARGRGTEGTVAIIGEPETALFLAERFLTADRFNNITGRRAMDRLPDFAGERISAYLDEVNAPYSALTPEKGDSLREVTVRCVLAALDTASRIRSFNADALEPKQPAKLLVLSSTLCHKYGYADVDTLLKMASLPLPVVTPVASLLDEAFSRPAKHLNIGVWTDPKTLESGVFAQAFEKRAAALDKDVLATLQAFSPDGDGDLGDRFCSFLEKYFHKGTAFPLSVLCIDDYGVDVALLNRKLEEIRRMESPETMELNKLLAPDFRFVDLTEALTDDVYRILRSRNLFTHDIAYPRMDAFQTEPLGTGFVFVHSVERNIPLPTLDFVRENTSVVNQYYAIQGKH